VKDNSLFNPTRVLRLIRNDIGMGLSRMRASGQSIQMNTIGLAVLLSIAVVAFILWLSAYRDGPFIDEGLVGIAHGASCFSLFLVGCVLTSMAFKEVHNSDESYGWLTVPGSQLEKYVGRLFLTSIGFVLIAAVFYGLFVMLLMGFTKLLFGNMAIAFNPFDGIMLDYIGYYLILHSLFIVGSVVFKELVFFKAAIVIFGYWLWCGISWDRYAKNVGLDGIDALHTEPIGILGSFVLWRIWSVPFRC